ncbi:GIY-YIG nuclease family protein [Patescibacteria group bacterium]|nr:GIY-YIG nuclease family protein [Patescibacteria group bacterium]
MKGYVYILKVRNGNRYIGSTINLEKRVLEHMRGKVFSTKNKLPVTLMAYRFFEDVKEASLWEKKYKKSHGQLERDIKKGILLLTPDGLPAGQSPLGGAAHSSVGRATPS